MGRYGRSVPLVAAAVCPHPPLLVPEVAAGAAGETAGLRSGCDAAVGHLYAARPDLVVVVAAADRAAMLAPPYRGDLRPWGAPGVGFSLGAGQPSEVRPLGLLIGGWLLARTPGDAPVEMATVAADAPPGDCAAWGADFAAGADRVALLAMGDGSACRGVKAPGYDDPRAAPYDRAVGDALAAADIDALLRLDPDLSTELKAAGRAPWQALAGAADAAGHGWRGDLTYDAAPYGVAYFVATWAPA